jgi:hypothetical protein
VRSASLGLSSTCGCARVDTLDSLLWSRLEAPWQLRNGMKRWRQSSTVATRYRITVIPPRRSASFYVVSPTRLGVASRKCMIYGHALALAQRRLEHTPEKKDCPDSGRQAASNATYRVAQRTQAPSGPQRVTRRLGARVGFLPKNVKLCGANDAACYSHSDRRIAVGMCTGVARGERVSCGVL